MIHSKWFPLPLVISAIPESVALSAPLSGVPPVALILPFESTFLTTIVVATRVALHSAFMPETFKLTEQLVILV